MRQCHGRAVAPVELAADPFPAPWRARTSGWTSSVRDGDDSGSAWGPAYGAAARHNLPTTDRTARIMQAARTSAALHRRHTFTSGATDGCTRSGVAICRATLTQWRPGLPDELVGNTLLVAAELLGNAARHAGGPLHLDLELRPEDAVRICVSDASPDPPVPRNPSETGGGGYGLLIVGRIASRWGSHPTGRGKTVWADVPMPRL